MKIIQILACAIVLASSNILADETEVSKPSISASRTVSVAAEVQAIDHETREVTLASADGETFTFTASDEVRNLGQVEVGDRVLAEIHEEINISVYANPEGLEPGAGTVSAMGRAAEGAMPAGGAMDTLIITAVVEEIDLENNTFKLRGPQGNIKQFAARNPENLRRAEVGDLVVISITQAAGIMVERPAED